MLARVPAVAAWLDERGADLVHAHLPLAGVTARLAARIAGVPAVYTEHNLQERYHPLTRRANLATWRLQRAAVAVSGEVADSIARHAPPGVPLRVVRNGIETSPVDEAAGRAVRAALGVPPGAPLVGTVAVFRRQKRLDHWLDVARRIAESEPAARFVLVGDGPLRDEVGALAERLGLAGRVSFTGLQDDVRPYLAALDLYLMTSEFEGLPLALLEAMAAARAVAVTAVGGVPEAVEDGVCGVVRPFGDLDGLAAAALTLLADAGRRTAFGAEAQRRVEASFGIRRMAAELEALYGEVLAGAATRDPPPRQAAAGSGRGG